MSSIGSNQIVCFAPERTHVNVFFLIPFAGSSSLPSILLIPVLSLKTIKMQGPIEGFTPTKELIVVDLHIKWAQIKNYFLWL